jgi:membrane associated rhomboid family serine protease
MIQAPVGFQCPECVDEARKEFRRGPGRATRGGVSATKVLLFGLVAMYAVEVILGGPGSLLQGPNGQTLFDLGAMFPPAIANEQYWRLFSPIFLHAGLLHLGFNAYALWIFGRPMEDALGRTWFLVIFFVSGFLASVASYAFGPLLVPAVGASGAIFGIFGAFIAYNWRRRETALAQANLRMAGMLLLLNFLLAVGYRAIDWRAHVGGLIAGLVVTFIADGLGRGRNGRLLQIAGVAGMIALGIAMTVWRTDAIRALPQFQAIFGL